MRFNVMLLLMTSVLTTSVLLSGQERQHFSDPHLLAKLSFDNSGAVMIHGIQHICIAVFQDGAYRMVRRPVPGMFGSDPAQLTERTQGAMSEDQLQQLKALLDSPDLQSLEGNHGGIIRQSAETFAAEIPTHNKQVSERSFRIQWLNGDGQSPFPPPVSKILGWLNHFEPVNPKPLADLEFQDVCPSVGLQRVQPTIASNVP